MCGGIFDYEIAGNHETFTSTISFVGGSLGGDNLFHNNFLRYEKASGHKKNYSSYY